MVDDEPYDLLPHREIAELKRQMQELKAQSDKSSSQQLMNSMNALTKSMDSMLKLFTEAAQELKLEAKEEADVGDKIVPINEKLDEIIEQNKTIAEGMVAISDMVSDFINKQKPRSVPKHDFMEPKFKQEPEMQPPPSFDQPLDDFSHRGPQGPVPMPSMPFSSLDKKPKKKGFFGRR